MKNTNPPSFALPLAHSGLTGSPLHSLGVFFMKQEHLQIIQDFTKDYPDELINEKWVDFGNGRFKYKVSSDGRLMRYWKTRKRWQYHTSSPASNGYLRVRINYKHFYTHQLVGQLFIPNPENKETINHKNGNKHDNRVDNLEWNTKSENNLNAYAIGLKDNKGVSNGRAKVTEEDVLAIREMCKLTNSNIPIAKHFNVSPQIICHIRLRQTWKHI